MLNKGKNTLINYQIIIPVIADSMRSVINDAYKQNVEYRDFTLHLTGASLVSGKYF